MRRALASVFVGGGAALLASCGVIAGLGPYGLAPDDAAVSDATSDAADVAAVAADAAADVAAIATDACVQAADCMMGQVCCVSKESASGLETQCKPSCHGMEPQSCRTDGECARMGGCTSWVCAGMSVATCGGAGSESACR